MDVLETARGFFASVEAEAALTDDLGSQGLARAALADTLDALPQAWNLPPSNASWLLILPRSHPLAGLHPIAVGVATGRKLTVRTTGSKLLARYLDRFPQVERVDETLRISAERDAAGFDAVMAFGDDATVASIARTSGKPVQGFGERAGIAVVHAEETGDVEIAAKLARDAFSLNQSGCMSARLAVVVGEGADVDALVTNVAAATRALHGNAELPLDVRLGQELERARLAHLGFSLHLPRDAASPLLATTRTAHDAMLARRAYALPIILLENASLRLASTIGTVTASPQVWGWIQTDTRVDFAAETPCFRPLGAAHAAPWNATHEGRVLFTS